MTPAYILDGILMTWEELCEQIRESFEANQYGAGGVHRFDIIDGLVSPKKQWFITRDERSIPLQYDQDSGLYFAKEVAK